MLIWHKEFANPAKHYNLSEELKKPQKKHRWPLGPPSQARGESAGKFTVCVVFSFLKRF